MLNRFIGMGRITAPLELRKTSSGLSVVAFSIAVERDYKTESGEKVTDFLNVVAWRNTADFIVKYFDKGSLICIEGSVQNRSYTNQNGEKRTVTEILADKVHFTGEKKNSSNNAQNSANTDEFTAVLDDDTGLPF